MNLQEYETQKRYGKKPDPLLLCGITIALSIVVAAVLLAGVLENHNRNIGYPYPTYSSNDNDYYQLELMEIDGLLDYLAIIYPTSERIYEDGYIEGESYSTDADGNSHTYAYSVDAEGNTHEAGYADKKYEEERNKLKSELKQNILDGDWPGFPYIQIGDQLYFTKSAVKEWFEEQSKKQLVVGK